MTHSIQLLIIGLIVFAASYIILRLLRDNERLILELEEAKAEARTLDADLDEARRANKECDKDIQFLNGHIKILNKKLTVYNKEAKGYEISLNALDAEHRKTIQHLYGRIGAMQRKINRLKSLP